MCAFCMLVSRGTVLQRAALDSVLGSDAEELRHCVLRVVRMTMLSLVK